MAQDPAKVETLPNAGGFIASEANGFRSRDGIKVNSATVGVIPAGSVLAKSGAEYVQYDNAGSGSVAVAAGILYDDVTIVVANTAVPGVAVVRDAEVNIADLKFIATADQTAKDAALVDLATVGIIGRAAPATFSVQTT